MEGAWYASLSRFTLDGAGKAKTAIQHGPAFATANECNDVMRSLRSFSPTIS